MYEALGAAAGAGAGGILGQLGETLSAPRRALWRMFGGPENGNELVSQLTGMDKESMLAKALGMGTEMALDPLNLVGAGIGALGGGAMRLGNKFGKMASMADEIPELTGSISALDKAADADRALNYAKESQRLAKIDPRFGTPTTYKDAIISQVPDLDEIARVAARKDMAGSTLTPTGMKSYKNFDPDVARLMEQDALGNVNPRTGQLEVLPNVRTDPKAYKFIGPPSTEVRGGKLMRDALARDPIPDEFLPDMPPSLRVVKGRYPRIRGGVKGFPASADEMALRSQSAGLAGSKEEILSQLQQMSDPEKYGLIEDLLMRGPESPLGQALLAGTAAGGSMYFGSKLMGQ